MRPNQKEGMVWLRKAADSAGLEVADDEKASDSAADYLERKARKAQFALSIYELGVSHMNGWGIDQDKVLALRCFEIAGCKLLIYRFSKMYSLGTAWGDADALAEAGYCYAQGIGCKKDLKKSARLYRQAEAKGISMVGNSWFVDAYLFTPNPLTPAPGFTNPNTPTIPIARENLSSRSHPPKRTRNSAIRAERGRFSVGAIPKLRRQDGRALVVVHVGVFSSSKSLAFLPAIFMMIAPLGLGWTWLGGCIAFLRGT